MSRQIGFKEQRYDVENLEEVAAQVRAKCMSLTMASKVYNIYLKQPSMTECITCTREVI